MKLARAQENYIKAEMLLKEKQKELETLTEKTAFSGLSPLEKMIKKESLREKINIAKFEQLEWEAENELIDALIAEARANKEVRDRVDVDTLEEGKFMLKIRDRLKDLALKLTSTKQPV